ncbi:hypothetical protein COU78_02125 [Candidatus Peregrinibacteria bacterium CG10_big_fil_rev_8_21_14_0_10_49_24]|nr:MAG: hypothetical protein COV83_03725 [Candidatus Peregrinibacteria bacterium CG11_big_fil_rev_8_21_14_0_20_49_14]PIR51285.1 MAG: hypothetical protein COU78_02125 [Candidatus Peregrinibacteria bacterium CG10_big_fil_rev_8_21_14_0_10_49_24]PJA68163.1 MAG: hypothetical protein CO157_00890 [Candidatus Peregrinibacteria bacterium CG_4_9_14_3_um_filter_49_12]
MRMSAFLTVALVHFLGMISPGPDFAIVSKNSLVHSRKKGVLTALGIALGLEMHVTYSLLGIGFIISKSIVLYSLLKYVGAAYLLYIGWKALRSQPTCNEDLSQQSCKKMTNKEAFCNGLLTNMFNPKVTLFMLALFTQVIDPATPLLTQALYGAYMGVSTFLWFSFLACILSLSTIKNIFRSIQHYVERVMGAVLIALGLKVATSE